MDHMEEPRLKGESRGKQSKKGSEIVLHSISLFDDEKLAIYR